MWDVLSVDYNRNVRPLACLSNTTKTIRAGSIIVFHDSYKAEKNMSYALPRMIEHAIKNGFVFKTIPT
jgi:peptidoglycan/xylan/chitin deacetylase (PgdA/CDA1 family)